MSHGDDLVFNLLPKTYIPASEVMELADRIHTLEILALVGSLAFISVAIAAGTFIGKLLHRVQSLKELEQQSYDWRRRMTEEVYPMQGTVGKHRVQIEDIFEQLASHKRMVKTLAGHLQLGLHEMDAQPKRWRVFPYRPNPVPKPNVYGQRMRRNT